MNVLNKNFKATKDAKVDIKLRTTREGGKFALKYGNWHKAIARKEFEIDFDPKQLPELLNMLLVLGYKYYLMIYIQRSEYSLKGMTVTLDKYLSTQKTLMEVEIVAKNKKDLKVHGKKIENFLSTFSLSALDSKGTINWINYLNNLKKWRVDFSKNTPETWFKKWKDYVYCLK